MRARTLPSALLIASAVLVLVGVVALLALPTGVAVTVLLAAALACFVAEAAAPGVGAFAGGGALATIVAGLLLLQRPAGTAVTAGIVLAVGVIAAIVSLVLASVAVRSRETPESIGAAGTMVGAIGVVKEADGWTGQVLVEGARWKAVSTAPLHAGMRVEVVALEGLTATVRPVDPALRRDIR